MEPTNSAHYSIRDLLLGIGILSLGFAGIATGSQLLINALFTLTLCILSIATIGFVVCRNRTQKFCGGVAACGWAYLAVAFVHWFRNDEMYYLLISSAASDLAFPLLEKSIAMAGSYHRYKDQEFVAQGMHVLFTLVVAWLGGWGASCWLTEKPRKCTGNTDNRVTSTDRP